LVKARVRANATWSDACILNLSTRGMLLRAARSPVRGSYLEIRRGIHVIIARVVWAKPDRFGVQTQDPVHADSLIVDAQKPPAQTNPQGCSFIECRAAPRPSEVKHEASRRRSHAIEFRTFLLLGAIATLVIGESVAEALGKPLAAVNSVLAGN
jgi:hypothetical protein